MKGVYRESWPRIWGGAAILLTAFLLLYLPWKLGEREFYWNEGAYAAQASEMNLAFPMATAHGAALRNAMPLYPYIGAVLNRYCHLPMEQALRLTSVAMLFALSLVGYYAAKLARDYRAGMVAFACIAGTVLAVEKGIDGYPALLTVFWIFSAHLVLFHYGMRQGKWNIGWIFSLGLAALGFYSGGFSALLYYLFPLFFMRRPLSLGSRLNWFGAYFGMFLVVMAVVFWALPYFWSYNDLPIQYLPLEHESFKDYLLQLASYPLDVFLRFLPWSVLGWIPLCVALYNVDDTPLFSRFLRTLLFSNFFLLWFMPGFEPEKMFILAGPFGVLLGINYVMAFRRYGWKIRNPLVFGSLLFSLLCVAGIYGFYFIPEAFLLEMFNWSRPLDFRNDALIIIPAMLAGVLLLAAWFLFYLRGGKRYPVWMFLLLCSVSGAMFFWQVAHPYRAQENSKRSFGRDIRAALARENALDKTVYKLDISDLYGEFYYVGVPVKKLSDINALSTVEKEVYLVSTGFPLNADWNWKNLLPGDYSYRKHGIRLWKGTLRQEEEY